MEEKISETHVKKLRNNYIKSTPQQRLHIIKQLINNSSLDIHKFLIKAFGVEALARSILLQINIDNKIKEKKLILKKEIDIFKEKEYEKIKRTALDELIKEIYKIKKININSVFNQEILEILPLIREYRNLLVHESTFLRAGFTLRLIEFIDNIFKELTLLTKK